MSEEQQQFTLGIHVKIEDVWYLPVRFVKQSTFHEETTTGTQFIDHEEFVELRDKDGGVKFASLSSSRTVANRDAGPCRGIKPYFWKGTV
jgi:hypothetical protein